MAKYNDKGQELPDQTPVALPLGHKVPETLQQMIARMVQVHSIAAVKEGLEDFEESDDFDIEDDLPKSTYQMTDMEEELPRYKPSTLKSDQKTETEKPPAKPGEPAAALTKEK